MEFTYFLDVVVLEMTSFLDDDDDYPVRDNNFSGVASKRPRNEDSGTTVLLQNGNCHNGGNWKSIFPGQLPGQAGALCPLD